MSDTTTHPIRVIASRGVSLRESLDHTTPFKRTYIHLDVTEDAVDEVVALACSLGWETEWFWWCEDCGENEVDHRYGDELCVDCGAEAAREARGEYLADLAS